MKIKKVFMLVLTIIHIFCFIQTKVFAQDEDEIQHSYAFPIPCYINKGEKKINFVNLPDNAVVKIYTINGENVLTIEEGNNGKEFEAVWDFDKFAPQSEVYIFVISKGSVSKEGKIVVIR